MAGYKEAGTKGLNNTPSADGLQETQGCWPCPRAVSFYDTARFPMNLAPFLGAHIVAYLEKADLSNVFVQLIFLISSETFITIRTFIFFKGLKHYTASLPLTFFRNQRDGIS